MTVIDHMHTAFSKLLQINSLWNLSRILCLKGLKKNKLKIKNDTAQT